MNYYEEALKLHEKHQGKIHTELNCEINTMDDMSVVYTPGVAEPCRKIAENEEDVFLDDISVEELSRKMNVEIVIVDEGGSDLVSAVLDPIEHKKQKRRQMYEQTGSSNCGQA